MVSPVYMYVQYNNTQYLFSWTSGEKAISHISAKQVENIWCHVEHREGHSGQYRVSPQTRPTELLDGDVGTVAEESRSPSILECYD